ncbi:hypothetical protein ACFPK1_16230 [Actinomycetospora rhizophila]|uniref:Uncharacterized protein n=1 Tax=Actinomycetospora rhizophila TaxID=1416876 RepID=A0ABV9ZEG6_9PSEU
MEASAQDAAEAAAGLLLSAAALAADTLAAVLSPADVTAEVIGRVRRCDRGSARDAIGEPEVGRLHRRPGQDRTRLGAVDDERHRPGQ